MPKNPEYAPGSAIPRVEVPKPSEISFENSEEITQVNELVHSFQERDLDKELAAVESLNQASKHIIELSEGDFEVVEMLHLLGNELDLIAHQQTGAEINVEARISLLKRSLRAAAKAAHEEIGRG